MKKILIPLIFFLLFGGCVTPTDDNNGDGPQISNIQTRIPLR